MSVIRLFRTYVQPQVGRVGVTYSESAYNLKGATATLAGNGQISFAAIEIHIRPVRVYLYWIIRSFSRFLFLGLEINDAGNGITACVIYKNGDVTFAVAGSASHGDDAARRGFRPHFCNKIAIRKSGDNRSRGTGARQSITERERLVHIQYVLLFRQVNLQCSLYLTGNCH